MVADLPPDSPLALPPECLGHPVPTELELSVPGHRQALEPTRQAVLGFLSNWDIGARVRFNVELILEETLLNAMLHGFRDNEIHLIRLHVRVMPTVVELTFEDDGDAFDPTNATDPVRPRSLDQATPGGLGLMLVRKLARSVSYRRMDRRNSLSIQVDRH